MAELVDALDSKSSSGNRVRVRFPPRVQKRSSFQQVRPFLIENPERILYFYNIFIQKNPPVARWVKEQNQLKNETLTEAIDPMLLTGRFLLAVQSIVLVQDVFLIFAGLVLLRLL